MTVLTGAPLALPYYAVVANAYQTIERVINPAPAANANYKVRGDGVEVITSVFCALLTSAVAGNRGMLFAYLDADNNEIGQIPSAAVQGPSQFLGYQNLLTITQTQNPGTGTMIGPLLSVVMQPGYTFSIDINPAQAGDQLQAIALLITRFPTGRPASDTSVAQAPALV